MAWQDILIPMVRNLIGDVSDTPKYEDSRIEQAIITGGLIVAQEYEFDNDYTFDFVTPDISPDPTDTATLDNEAVALFGLKAACILSINNYQTAVGQGIFVKDEESSINTTAGFSGYKDIINMGPCAAYKSLLTSLSVKQGMNNGQAVLSPYSNSEASHGWGGDGYYDIKSFFNSWRYW